MCTSLCQGVCPPLSPRVMYCPLFPRVIDGLETLDELEKLPVNEKTFRPLTDVRIKEVVIHANPLAF